MPVMALLSLSHCHNDKMAVLRPARYSYHELDWSRRNYIVGIAEKIHLKKLSQILCSDLRSI